MDFKENFLLLLEATKEDIKKYYPSISDEDFNNIVDADPTGTKTKVGSLCRLVLDLFKKSKHKFSASGETLHDVYVAFDTIKKRKDSLTDDEVSKYRNLNAIDDYRTLMDVKYYLDQKATGKIKLKSGEGENIEVFYEDDKWKVLIPLDYKASVKLGREYDAGWCTASSSAIVHYNRYIIENDLFVLVNLKANEAYQYFDGKYGVEFNNKKNIEVDPHEFSRENDIYDVFSEIAERCEKNRKNPRRLIERYYTSKSPYIVLAIIDSEVKEQIEEVLKQVSEKERREKILIEEDARSKKYTTINLELFLSGYEKKNLLDKESVGMGCERLDIKKYTVNDDLSVDTGPVYLSHNKYLKKNGRLPIKFNKVDGAFIAEYAGLTSLENFPKHVTYNVSISKNRIESLKGGPEIVEGNYNCSNNLLKDLVGAPKSCKNFDCSSNFLESLKGAPEIVHDFIVYNNNALGSLKDLPRKIQGDISLSNCGKKFTEEDVLKFSEVSGHIR